MFVLIFRLQPGCVFFVVDFVTRLPPSARLSGRNTANCSSGVGGVVPPALFLSFFFVCVLLENANIKEGRGQYFVICF